MVDDLGHIFDSYQNFHLALTFRNNKDQPLNSGFIAVKGTTQAILRLDPSLWSSFWKVIMGWRIIEGSYIVTFVVLYTTKNLVSWEEGSKWYKSNTLYLLEHYFPIFQREDLRDSNILGSNVSRHNTVGDTNLSVADGWLKNYQWCLSWAIHVWK